MTNPKTAPVTVRVADRIAHVVINRPGERNALNREVVGLLTEAFLSLGKRSDAGAVLLYGEGDSAFCAGADLRELVALGTASERREFFGGIASMIEAIMRCPLPVVAKVHGYALAGGCGLAAAADVVLASEEATFGLPEIKLGIAPMIIMAPLSRAIGQKVLADLVLSGDQIGARRALDIGLASRVFPKAELDREAERYAAKVAGYSPIACSRAKEALASVSDAEIFSSLGVLADKVALLASTENAKEGIDSFLEKRPPVWR